MNKFTTYFEQKLRTCEVNWSKRLVCNQVGPNPLIFNLVQITEEKPFYNHEGSKECFSYDCYKILY